MADPFEVRVRFSSALQNLNASVTSAQKVAAYALKYKDMDEDLHSCIIEQLEKPQTALNTRANIMYFLEHFLELAEREGHIEYVRMIQRDIIRVVEAVAPESGQGAANVKVVRRVLHALQQRGFLESQAVTEIEEVLKERESELLSPSRGAGAGAGSRAVAAGSGAGPGMDGEHRSGGGSDSMDVDGHNGEYSHHSAPKRLDKKQIEERIEEDRERHKRLRENIWAVPKTQDAEMWKIWDETSDLGEDDHLMGEEEEAERARNVQTSCPHRELIYRQG